MADENNVVEDDWLADDTAGEGAGGGDGLDGSGAEATEPEVTEPGTGAGEGSSESTEQPEEEQPEVEQPDAESPMSPIAEDLRAVIANGSYKLSDMLAKLSRLWVEDQITESEFDTLVSMARDNASVESEGDVDAYIAAMQSDIRYIKETMADVVSRLEKLEGKEPSPDPEPEVYPEYEQGHWYYNGDKVSFNGKKYKCIAPDGQVCVWSPTDYPAYWEEVTDGTE